MHPYLLFLVMAAATVLSPGPGVVMTLTNALRYGLRGSFGSILGIAFGALVVAGTSATSLGVLLATSALAFTVLKLVGAAYLIYLGVRLWRSPALRLSAQPVREATDVGQVRSSDDVGFRAVCCSLTQHLRIAMHTVPSRQRRTAIAIYLGFTAFIAVSMGLSFWAGRNGANLPCSPDRRDEGSRPH